MPLADQPPVNVVRFAFQTMVGIGTLLGLLGLIYLCIRLRRRRLPTARWFYAAVVLAGPLSVVALIAGWITTEVGRQPWIVYEVMKVDAAVTGAHVIPVGYGALCVVYIGLAGAVAWLLRRFSQVPLETDEPPGGHADAATTREHTRPAIGPAWEANHVWLIFVLTVAWTCYPVPFGSIVSTLAIPLLIAAIGIIFRGTAYALRSQLEAGEGRAVRVVEDLFALSSVLAVAFSGYLAAVYLAADAHRLAERALVRDFRIRALAAGVVAGTENLAGVSWLRFAPGRGFTGVRPG